MGAVRGDSSAYEAGARFDTSPHRIRSQSHCVAADEEHYQGARATLCKTASAIGVRSIDREKWSLERGVDVGCGKFACGKQRLGGSILTVAAALRSLSGRFWAGGLTGQQTGQAGQHRTDRTDRTASRTAETVLSLALRAALGRGLVVVWLCECPASVSRSGVTEDAVLCGNRAQRQSQPSDPAQNLP